MTQSDVFDEIQSVIPANLWAKYSSKSFGEMAEIPELAEWSDELRQADSDWYSASDA